jgi:type IV pilus assembly protein PilV
MKQQLGFSMIEVLVSVVVLMFGVLGMASLQGKAINNTELARYNSRAAVQASSIAATMKANVSYWGAPPAAISVQGATVTGGPVLYQGDCYRPTVCTPAQLAYFDLVTWGRDIAASLPVGRFDIACDLAISPAVCTVTVSWLEKNILDSSIDSAR